MSEAMQRRVPIQSKQYGSAVDMNNVGVFAVGAMDAMGADIVGPDNAWTEMAVLQESSSSVRVNFGRIWRAGKFYGNPDAVSEIVSLVTTIPTSTKKVVTIIATGAEIEANLLPRSFYNEETGLKEAQTVATEIRRALTLSYVAGAEAGTPQAPDLDANYVPVANVLLGTGGIESIELLTDYELPTQQGMGARLLSLEVFRQTIGSRVETLASDLGNLNDKIGSSNLPVIKLLARKLADMADQFGVDDTALLWGFDRFMTDAESDINHVDWNARIEEGLRFPYAASASVVPTLLNPADPSVETISGWTLPVFDNVLRLDIWGQYISVNLSSYQYSNTSYTIYPGPSRRRRYGTSMVVAENEAFWQSSKYGVNYMTNTFMQAGETWLIEESWIDDDTGVTQYRVQQYWDDAIKYWNGYQAITPTAANGYLIGQTFLNAQAGWMTQIGLRFSKVDAAYDVTVLVCKVDRGEPDLSQIIATGTLLKENALASVSGDGNENPVTLTPVFLEPGQRYGVILVTGGDYAVACRTDNALSNGSLFNGDGNSWVADLGKDMNMRLYFARFQQNFVAVDLQPVTLGGGITDFDAITREHSPAGSECHIQIQIDGLWKPFAPAAGAHPLAAKPVTLPMRLVMVGTSEVMPAIKLGESEISFHLSDDDFTYLSEIRDAGAAAASVELQLRIVGWDAGKHALTATIESGVNSDAPSSTTDVVQADGSILRTMSFTLTLASQTYQIKLVGTSTDISDLFVVGHRYDLAAA
jgi:hypothetical protein